MNARQKKSKKTNEKEKQYTEQKTKPQPPTRG
ncbi:MAG: hypothetical protein PWR03_1703 [Tenuifilum sp.]|jgi:hypothetical protein|nr:hypothetical protein [Tenuifilum sp.]